MKYNFLLTSALTSLCFLSSTAALAANSTKMSAEKPARWFEIEVILFKHTSTKADNKEQFTARDLRAKKRRAFDLFAPYLQPNIASLKQLLPNCQQPQSKLPYNISLTPYNLWPAITSKESTDAELSDKESAVGEVTNIAEGNTENFETVNEQYDSQAKAQNKETVISSAKMSVTVLTDTNNDTTEARLDEKTETEAELATAAQSYQAQYANIELPVYDQYPSYSKSALCVIPADFFQQHLSAEQLENFSLDGYPVEKLATTINGLEQWQDDENGKITWASDKAYLISQDSLRLKSIANRIKRSRDYKPLLHLGWRQIGATRRQAQAMKLYAGEHLEFDYQQALTQQQAEQTALELEAILAQRQQNEALINSQLLMVDNDSNQGMSIGIAATNNTNLDTMTSDILTNQPSLPSDELSITEQLRQQAKQQQLNNIYPQFALLDSSLSHSAEDNKLSSSVNDSNEPMLTEEQISHVVAQLSADINKQQSRQLSGIDDQENQAATQPLQPWYLDGLFKVHLHLDNRLYINSEFNMLESANESSVIATSADQNAKADTKNKVISFKQDRRVITGEIHYFDHPLIGMVVQIRRFDPTKPASEAVTQAKK